MVPNGWSIQKLEQIATVERGKFSARPRNDPKYFGGNIPFVQTGDIAAAKTYLQNYTQTLNEDGLKVSRLFPKNTILITIAANIGDTAITSFDVACPDSLVAIRTHKDTDCFWLKLYLETCKDELDGKATQNAQKNINLQVLKPLEVLTPPLPEQRKIAKILSTWDKAIATTEKLIDASQQQKKALMQQLLTGKKRLVNPDTGKVFEGEWELTHLKSLLIEEKSRNKDNKITRVLSVTNHSGFVLPEDQFSKRVASENISNYKIVKQGQFGYNPSRLNVGSFACLNQFSEGVLSPMYVVFSTNDSKLQRDYLSYWMDSHEAKQRIKNSTQGSVRESVGFDALCSFPFILPALNEQQKIASVLTAADKEIELLQAKLAHLKDEKKALMQQLLTGKRRVKVDENVTA
ncbi:restriction endonuclease subunit S [Providencia stuartii]|uniref:restriction endonuclease subunit S n=1 Tax=Providencia stuartii TaxID=588 RepID=UPI0034E54364